MEHIIVNTVNNTYSLCRNISEYNVLFSVYKGDYFICEIDTYNDDSKFVTITVNDIDYLIINQKEYDKVFINLYNGHIIYKSDEQSKWLLDQSFLIRPKTLCVMCYIKGCVIFNHYDISNIENGIIEKIE